MNKIISLLLVVFALFCSACIDFGNFNIISSKAQAEAEASQVLAFHILVPTEAQANEIREDIMKGQTRSEIFSNFTSTARKYSKCPSGADGGKLGWFGRGEMVRAFENAAFSIPTGTVSEPVKTQFGWHLIYVVNRK